MEPEFGDVIVLRDGSAKFCLGVTDSDLLPVQFLNIPAPENLREQPLRVTVGGGMCDLATWRKMERTGKEP